MDKSDQFSKKQEVQFYKGIAELASNFYNAVSRDENGNVVISPYSFCTLVALLYMGSADPTSRDIRKALKLPGGDELQHGALFESATSRLGKDYVLSSASTIFADKSLRIHPVYISQIRRYFSTEITILNFDDKRETITTINKWVKSKTKDKGNDFVDDNIVDDDTRLVIANALYFKGYWEKPFNRQDTRKQKFYISKNKTVDIDMMHMECSMMYLPNEKELNASIIELPCGHPNKVSVMIILPNKGTDIRTLENNIGKTNILCLSQKLKPNKVSLDLPKFKFDYFVNCQKPCTKIGLGALYSKNANFTKMLPAGGARVTKVIQQVYIDVNESSIEGRASGLASGGISSQGNFAKFKADRPFLFVIKTKITILLIGRYSPRN